MKKKVLAALMCAAMTVGMLAGCGGNSTAGNSSSDAGKQHPYRERRQRRRKKRWT